MIDRWGNTIRVGWAAHEMIWVEASLELPTQQRREAYKDIADMSGRSYEVVRKMAVQLRAARLRALEAMQRPVRMRLPVSLPPSQIKPPSLSQLMGRR